MFFELREHKVRSNLLVSQVHNLQIYLHKCANYIYSIPQQFINRTNQFFHALHAVYGIPEF